jgi:glycosyltransferase involved in cell wall biosynthesis
MNILMPCGLDVWSLAEGMGAPTLYRTLRAYGQRGHRVFVVSPSMGANRFGPPRRPPQSEGRPQIANVSFHTFNLPSLAELPLRFPGLVAKADQKLRFALLFPALAARQAERILLNHTIDLLYGYEVHGALTARLLHRRYRLPTVARFQGTVMHPALGSRRAYYRKYEEVLALRTPADLYIMTDDGTRGDEVLARLNPASKGRVRFWRNGLDLDRLAPSSAAKRAAARRTLGLPAKAFVMLTASRLALWKRVDRAVRALPRLLPRVPQALLLVLGDGEERANLESLARDLGVADAVRFEGAVPQGDVVGYMHAADLFLALADLSNVGNPLLEAMACGMAILTLDVGDTADLIRDGETGRLLPAGDERALVEAMVSLAGDPELRRKLGLAAHRHAKANFWSWEERLAAEIEEVERLVGGA